MWAACMKWDLYCTSQTYPVSPDWVGVWDVTLVSKGAPNNLHVFARVLVVDRLCEKEEYITIRGNCFETQRSRPFLKWFCTNLSFGGPLHKREVFFPDSLMQCHAYVMSHDMADLFFRLIRLMSNYCLTFYYVLGKVWLIIFNLVRPWSKLSDCSLFRLYLLYIFKFLQINLIFFFTKIFIDFS